MKRYNLGRLIFGYISQYFQFFEALTHFEAMRFTKSRKPSRQI